MPKFIHNTSVAACLSLLAACSFNNRLQPSSPGDTGSLAGLYAMASPKQRNLDKQADMGKIRETALRETALSLGAQSGLAWRAKFIDEQLTKETEHLNTIFDFRALILPHNVLPPVLLESRHTLNLADTQTIRVSDRIYKVAKQARFVTTPPDWRYYLWMDYQKPAKPNSTLLPKTKEERLVWAECVEKGWKNGVEQANTILEESIARIKEDYLGMILYRKLLAMNIVSLPFVSHTNLGITGNKEEIHIDDRVLRITALPALNTNSQEWRAVVAKDSSALKQFKSMEKRAKSAQVKITNKEWQPIITPTS